MLKNIIKNKKFKYGSVAVAFTAIFIAIIILLNAILSVFDSNFGLYTETTGEELYVLGDVTKEMLSGIDEEIEIIFCLDRDVLIEDNVMSKIVTLAEKYASEFDFISVRFVNLERNPAEVRRLAGIGTEDILNVSDTVIRTVSTGKTRVISSKAFFAIDENTGYAVGFSGEMRFTESILMAVNSSDDKVVIIKGHGEDISLTAIDEILDGAGYSSEEKVEVNLAVGDIPDNTKLVIINNPKRDFLGADSAGVNEISKLNDYLNSYGNIFVLLNDQTGQLPNLSELLESYGISYTPGNVVLDRNNSVAGSDGRGIIAAYNHSSVNVAGQKIADDTDISNSITLMPSSTPLTLDRNYAQPILQTSSSAIVQDSTGKNIKTGVQDIMAISSRFDIVNNEEKYSHLIVSGSTELISYASSTATKNADLIRNILAIAGTEAVTSNIETKLFNDTDISHISTDDARGITVNITVIPAVIVLIAGAVVFIRRKRL